jgi:hypothetical protein
MTGYNTHHTYNTYNAYNTYKTSRKSRTIDDSWWQFVPHFEKLMKVNFLKIENNKMLENLSKSDHLVLLKSFYIFLEEHRFRFFWQRPLYNSIVIWSGRFWKIDDELKKNIT